MTRQFTQTPVWAWYCDSCNSPDFELAWNQVGLPMPSEMRRRGWFIAEMFGDLCPVCVMDAPGLELVSE